MSGSDRKNRPNRRRSSFLFGIRGRVLETSRQIAEDKFHHQFITSFDKGSFTFYYCLPICAIIRKKKPSEISDGFYVIKDY